MKLLQDPHLLESYSHDECPELSPVLPLGVFQPKTTQEVGEAVQYCLKNNFPITPRSAGTGKSGGCIPVPGSVVIDFSQMNQIIAIRPEDMTATVQPGIILAEFRNAVEKQGLFYPPDPNSMAWCTLGGNVATNAAGPSALKYGCTRDYILGLEVVLASGDIMRLGKQTVKGVAGYDLVSLICGSEGTLALITEITVKLLPKPIALETMMLYFDSDQQALGAVNQILRAGYLPKTLEYMDSLCMQGRPALIIECDGHDSNSLLDSMQNMLSLVNPIDSIIATNENQRRHIWEQRKLMSVHLKSRRKHKVSEDIVVPRSRILEFANNFALIGKAHGVETGIFGHAGDGNLHAQLLFDQELDVSPILHDLFSLTINLGGTISGEHGIGLQKKKYLSLEQNSGLIDLQKNVKRLFDPENLLNQDKIFN